MQAALGATLAVALACAAAACATPTETARRSVTTIRTDPRPPEDTNLIPPAVPEPESTATIRRERRRAEEEGR